MRSKKFLIIWDNFPEWGIVFLYNSFLTNNKQKNANIQMRPQAPSKGTPAPAEPVYPKVYVKFKSFPF